MQTQLQRDITSRFHMPSSPIRKSSWNGAASAIVLLRSRETGPRPTYDSPKRIVCRRHPRNGYKSRISSSLYIVYSMISCFASVITSSIVSTTFVPPITKSAPVFIIASYASFKKHFETMSSASTNAIYFPEACSTPTFRARDTPPFSL